MDGWGKVQDKKYGAYYEMISEIAPYAQEKGVIILLKPYGGIALTSQDAIAICAKRDLPAYRICYASGNLTFKTKGKGDIYQDIERIVPLGKVIIIKDCLVTNGESNVKITPGEGLVDFNRVLGCFARNGFQGPIYVEFFGREDHSEIDKNLHRTRRFIENILAGLE
ncbi:sugar phosphate isomerase/epimerase family protein [Candidatus Hydrogenedentota bacterium]